MAETNLVINEILETLDAAGLLVERGRQLLMCDCGHYYRDHDDDAGCGAVSAVNFGAGVDDGRECTCARFATARPAPAGGKESEGK